MNGLGRYGVDLDYGGLGNSLQHIAVSIQCDTKIQIVYVYCQYSSTKPQEIHSMYIPIMSKSSLISTSYTLNILVFVDTRNCSMRQPLP